jgi:hypothetical protein
MSIYLSWEGLGFMVERASLYCGSFVDNLQKNQSFLGKT